MMYEDSASSVHKKKKQLIRAILWVSSSGTYRVHVKGVSAYALHLAC